ncbi:hypothetical protein [Actinomadura sp. HBU206391]|uniref:hypothetical protein n=1 Tax=Actinomadura sp. HBU206391 TaxID=2731692 RepID=UPI00164F7763|nr:hypothetical protein [Actinomadura sp. HBU206391]MBC6457027.1 hypothetical protein [Actinomadura sp. HBU206391]
MPVPSSAGPPDVWEDLWANLSPVWRRILAGTDTDTAPPGGPILRRRRITTDFEWVTTFEPLRWLPAVTEALLWDVNGMDLGPLTGRSWDLLQLAGPANVDLAQLRGTAIRRLTLSNVDVRNMSALRDVPGLESLTLAHGDFGALPPLAGLTELVMYAEVELDLTAVRGYPGLQMINVDEPYFPPFGPDEE